MSSMKSTSRLSRSRVPMDSENLDWSSSTSYSRDHISLTAVFTSYGWGVRYQQSRKRKAVANVIVNLMDISRVSNIERNKLSFQAFIEYKF